MQDVNHALSVLRARAGLAKLDFDAAGNAEIVVEGAMSVYLTRVSETEMELSCRIDPLTGGLNPQVMEQMLMANSLGDGTGAARLAVDPDRKPLLCQRVDVAPLDAAGFEARLTMFVRLAAYWQTDGAAKLIRDAGNPADATIPAAFDGGSFIRA